MFLLKLGLRPWRLALWSQIFSALAVGFLILLAGIVFWIDRGLKPVVMRLQAEQVITAYLDTNLSVKDEKRVVDQIKTSLGARPADVKLVDSGEFLKEIEKSYPDLGRELQDLGQEMNSVIPRYVSVAGVLHKSALDEIKGINGVESAESSKDRYKHIVSAFTTLRWVAKLLVAGLMLALLTGLFQLARMNRHLHEDALSLLKLWGANELTLRMPGILSGLVVGATGGLIAFSGWLFVSHSLVGKVKNLSPMLQEMPMPSASWAVYLFFVSIVVGMLSGLFGISIRGRVQD